jgi:hypothetical protein
MELSPWYRKRRPIIQAAMYRLAEIATARHSPLDEELRFPL